MPNKNQMNVREELKQFYTELYLDSMMDASIKSWILLNKLTLNVKFKHFSFFTIAILISRLSWAA